MSLVSESIPNIFRTISKSDVTAKHTQLVQQLFRLTVFVITEDKSHAGEDTVLLTTQAGRRKAA